MCIKWETHELAFYSAVGKEEHCNFKKFLLSAKKLSTSLFNSLHKFRSVTANEHDDDKVACFRWEQKQAVNYPEKDKHRLELLRKIIDSQMKRFVFVLKLLPIIFAKACLLLVSLAIFYIFSVFYHLSDIFNGFMFILRYFKEQQSISKNYKKFIIAF